MKPLAVLVLVLGCATTHAHTITVPTAMDRTGGLYQPWSPRHEREAREVLACAGLDSLGPRPSLWVAPVPLVQRDVLVMAFYDPDARAIIFAPYTAAPGLYWPVFRHEMIHHVTRRGNDAPEFAKADSCRFWPVNP